MIHVHLGEGGGIEPSFSLLTEIAVIFALLSESHIFWQST